MQKRSIPRVHLKDIEEARKRVTDVAFRTPLLPASSHFDDAKLYLKLECLQRTGSFKVRGAWNKMSRVSQEDLAKGFVTVSAGNHGQAVAWCARKLGSPCTVYVPLNAVKRKIESMESMGAKIVRKSHEEIMESMTDDRMEELGMVFVHPFGDPYVVAGQGTIGLEILEDLPNVRSVIVPVGGGGLVNGIATALRAKEREVESGGGERNHNKLKIFGVQAEGAAPLLKSFESGRAERIGDPHTIADGIAATYVFDYMFPLFKENEIQPLVVSDREIEQAMRHIMKECHAIAEPAGASSLAAAWRYRSQLEEPIVCVVSGGNADFSLLSRLISD